MSQTQLIDLSSLASHSSLQLPSSLTTQALPEIKEARRQTIKNNTHRHDDFQGQNNIRMEVKRRITMKIQCLSELTPLDMMDLSLGINDPTGSCMWMGAFFFLEIFARHLDLSEDHDDYRDHPKNGGTKDPNPLKCSDRIREAYLELSKPCSHLQGVCDLSNLSPIEMRQYLSYLRHYLFPPGCEILELGAGTGMSGLSLVVANQATMKKLSDEQPANNSPIRPSLLVLTDANEDSLELCQKNLESNINQDELIFPVHVKRLEWGPGNSDQIFCPSSVIDSSNTEQTSTNKDQHSATFNHFKSTSSLPSSYDTIFATDVLYDLSSLRPLLITASELQKTGGFFILSHVPRASAPKSLDADENMGKTEENSVNKQLGDGYDEYHAVGTSQQIEPIIIREALKVNLTLASFPESFTEKVAPDSKNCNNHISENIHSNSLIFRPTLLSLIWGELGMTSRNLASIHSSPLSTSSAQKKNTWQTMNDVGAAIIVFQKQ
ncbi:hypothetical protein ACHAXS_009534 [Conticribra weissflogii]